MDLVDPEEMTTEAAQAALEKAQAMQSDLSDAVAKNEGEIKRLQDRIAELQELDKKAHSLQQQERVNVEDVREMAHDSGLYVKGPEPDAKEVEEAFKVPVMFTEVFKRYNLKEAGFDIKQVLQSEWKRADFIKYVSKQVEKDKENFKVTVDDLIKAASQSWSPLCFLVLWIVQFVVEIFGPHPKNAIISAIRTFIFIGMVHETIKQYFC